MRKLLLFLAVGLLASYGAHAATIPVSGGTGLQTAIDGASSNDVIEIIDSATYTEDILVPPTITGLTIRAAAGQTPSVVATNTSSGRSLVGTINALAGLPAAFDGAGFIVEGQGTTVQGLTINNPASGINPLFGSANAFWVAADDVTIEDCTLTGIGDTGTDDATLVVITGDWVSLDALLGAGGALAGFGVTLSTNLTVTNSSLDNGNIGLAIIDLAQALALALAATPIPGTFQTSSTWTNVTVSNNDDQSQSTNTVGAIWTDCLFTRNLDAFGIEGGNWVFDNCVWSQMTASNQFIEVSTDVAFGGGLATFTVTDSVLCGGYDADGADNLVELENCQATFTDSIINVTNTDGLYGAFRFEPEEHGDLEDLGLPVDFDRILTIDNCDIYNPTGSAIHGDAEPWDPGVLNPAFVNVTDTIIVANQGVSQESTGAVAGSEVNVSFTDIFAGTQFGTIDGSWAQNISNILNVDPGYDNAGGCDKADYQYNNSNLATASSTGGGLGSQLPPEPPGSSVEKWEIYK